MSRACSSAIAASAACTLPTCLWLKPERLRTNTSKSGQSFSLTASPSGSASALLLGMRLRRLAHPSAFVVRTAPRLHALAVARAVAVHDVVELPPVDLAVTVVAGLRVPAQVRVGHLQPEEVRLRHGDVDELL